MKALTKIPKLKSGNDEAIAARLDELIIDASEGLRRIIIAGFLLEKIASELKHGEFKPWVEAHCKQASRRSIFGWRLLARNIMESVKLSKSAMLHFSVPVHEMLALPDAKVPKEQKEIREKIDALIEGKTARQIFAEFKQTEGPDDDGNMSPKRGRRKGEGGASAAQRAKAKSAAEAATIEGMEEDAENFGSWIMEMCDAAHLPKIADAAWATLFERVQTLHDFMKQINAARKTK